MSTSSQESLQQAADWFAILHIDSPSDQQRRQWQQWMQADPRHRSAWKEVEAVWNSFAALEPGAAHAALDAAGDGNGRARKNRRRALRQLGSALGVGAIAVIGWRQLPLAAWQASHRTAFGHSAQWRLPDGSTLWLNSASAATPDYDGATRTIRLHDGELLLQTAPDPQQPPRPLYVDTVAGRLHALGTRFSVRMEGARVLLNVYEGRVAIMTSQGRQGQAAAGQGRWFEAAEIGPLTAADPLRERWRSGRLVSEGEPLGRVIEELARYRRGYLGCDPRVAGLPLVASLQLGDSDKALELLAATLPIRIHRRLPWWVTVEPL